MKKAVILLSGGLDSTTCLAVAKSKGFLCHTLSFSYGQRHSAELFASARIAEHMDVARHEVVTLDTKIFAGSALTDTTIDVPTYTGTTDIPVTYVPARNTIFLSIALGFAESIGAFDVFIGVSSVDFSHYPDCRAEYIAAFELMANLATKAGVGGQKTTIHTPLQHLNKAQTIQLGHQLGVDYGLTVSCYKANEQGAACGVCDSCTFRRRGFLEAGVPDVTLYV